MFRTQDKVYAHFPPKLSEGFLKFSEPVSAKCTPSFSPTFVTVQVIYYSQLYVGCIYIIYLAAPRFSAYPHENFDCQPAYGFTAAPPPSPAPGTIAPLLPSWVSPSCFILKAVLPYPWHCTTAGGWLHHPRGGEAMPLTLTIHIGRYVITIRVKQNRHSGQ